MMGSTERSRQAATSPRSRLSRPPSHFEGDFGGRPEPLRRARSPRTGERFWFPVISATSTKLTSSGLTALVQFGWALAMVPLSHRMNPGRDLDDRWLLTWLLTPILWPSATAADAWSLYRYVLGDESELSAAPTTDPPSAPRPDRSDSREPSLTAHTQEETR